MRAFTMPKLAAATAAVVAVVPAVAAAGTSLAAASVSAAATAPATAPATTATTLPAIDAGNGGWSHLRIRPGLIVFGLGGAPFLTDLRWHRWTAAGADGSGRLYVQRPCTRPSYQCRYTSLAEIRLYRVRTHAGQPYFARMSVRFAGRAPGLLLTPTLMLLASGYWSSDRAWPSL